MISFLLLAVCQSTFVEDFINGYHNGSSFPLNVASDVNKNCSVYNAVEICLGNDTSVVLEEQESLYFTTVKVGRYIISCAQKATGKKKFFF
jgi:hypothetical protein